MSQNSRHQGQQQSFVDPEKDDNQHYVRCIESNDSSMGTDNGMVQPNNVVAFFEDGKSDGSLDAKTIDQPMNCDDERPESHGTQ